MPGIAVDGKCRGLSEVQVQIWVSGDAIVAPYLQQTTIAETTKLKPRLDFYCEETLSFWVLVVTQSIRSSQQTGASSLYQIRTRVSGGAMVAPYFQPTTIDSTIDSRLAPNPQFERNQIDRGMQGGKKASRRAVGWVIERQYYLAKNGDNGGQKGTTQHEQKKDMPI